MVPGGQPKSLTIEDHNQYGLGLKIALIKSQAF